MRRFALIGLPLGHSFSQRYFTAKFTTEGISDCIYDLFPLEDISQLPSLLDMHPDLEGLNVTIPYKEKVIPFLDDMSEVVRDCGACNCIRRTPTGLFGHNTDVVGFEQSLQAGLQPSHRQALILGTGGASKAVAYVLQKKGIAYRYVSRRPSQNSSILTYQDLDDTILSSHTLLINTTPLGTFPAIEEAPPIPYDLLTAAHYLFDLVYNPPVTKFLQEGLLRGATTHNGSDMLVIQAEESWRIWNAK